jgi:hypothetical protein
MNIPLLQVGSLGRLRNGANERLEAPNITKSLQKPHVFGFWGLKKF